ncbi:hypothetical protein REPUB_Repub09cG0023400 [Reevesia pubescens]
MEVASNNGVGTMNTVSESNPEISKGESFLISPEISKVVNETCGMSEHTEVDDSPVKAEKIPEDEGKTAIYKKFQLEEEAGTGENEIKEATEDRMEKGETDHGIEEMNLDIQGEKRVEEVKKIEDESKAEHNFEVSTPATDKKDSLGKENEEKEPEIEVCKESETAASATGKENPDMKEYPIADISNPSIADETQKESIKEDESSPMKLKEEASDSNIEETTFETVKESKEEITPIEFKEDLVHSSSVELEESKKDTEEETSVKGSINTADLDSASAATETEETNIKEVEAEEEKKDINNVLAVEENGLATTEHQGIGADSADIDVKPSDSSISCEKEEEIPQEENEMPDKVPNGGSEEVCLQKEEEKEPKAVSEEETIVDQGLQKEEPEEKIQTTSSTLPSEEKEHGTGAISKEIKYGKTKEEEPANLDAVIGDEITNEQTLSANKPEEETTSSALLSKELLEKNISMVEKTEEEKIKEVEIPDKISKDSSDAKKTAEICLEKEEFQELEDAKKDETAAAQAIQVEEPKKQSLTSSSELPSEKPEHGTTANVNGVEEEKVKEVQMLEKEICLEKERPQKPEAVVDQETTVAPASITEESLDIETICTVEKLDEEKKKEVEKLEDENCEDSSVRETKEIFLRKEEPNELQAVPKEEITSGQTFSEERSTEQLHISTSAITSEELEHETKKTEDEKTKKEEIVKDEISEDASDARTTEEICSQKERSIELEAVVEDEMTAGHNLPENKLEEQVQNPTSAPPSKEEECGSTSTTEMIESEKTKEAEFLQDDNVEEVSLQKERLQEDEALAKYEDASSQTLPLEKSEEQIPNPVFTLPSDDNVEEVSLQKERLQEDEALAKYEDASSQTLPAEKSEEQIPNPVVTLPSDDNVEEVSLQKERLQEDEALAKYEDASSETLPAEKSEEQIPNSVVTLPSDEHKHETVNEEDKVKEEEMQNEDSDGTKTVEEICAEKDETRGPQQKPADHLHITTSTLSSEVQEDESPEKIPEQTREIEEASNVKMETREKAFDNELLTESEDATIKEKFVEAKEEITRDEENQSEKTNEGNEIILNEVSKKEVLEDKEVTETSYSTSHLEELTKDGSGEDEIKDKLIEDETNEALETTQNDELVLGLEAQKISEIEIIEKQIVCEDKTVEDPGQASVSRIETGIVSEEESSTELSKAESTKDFAEGNEIIDDIRQAEETTNIASDKQIPGELYPTEKTEIASSIDKEHVQIELQDRVAESSEKAEVGDVKEISPKEAEHDGEKTADNSGEEIINKESTSVEDSTKVSSSDNVESSAKGTLQVTRDMIVEREAKDEIAASQILLVEKPEEQSAAPSSELPSEEGEHGVTTKVDAVEERELKEVETLDKDSSDTKTGGEICLENEGKKELKPVLEQESIAVQASSTEIPGEADPIETRKTTGSIGKDQFPTEQQDRALETSGKAEVGHLEPGNAQEICSEQGVDHGDKTKTDNSGVEIVQESASADSAKLSLSDLLQKPTRENMQVAERVIEERELTVSKEEPPVEEAETIEAKEAKTDEEKDEGGEHNKPDSGSDAPVMVEAPRDTDAKPHKKSHNILSGVGSKVKHSISKVKKAITGKSSHSKESKPISPKGSEK